MGAKVVGMRTTLQRVWLFIFLVACSNNPPAKVRFLIPSDFRGVFIVRLDPNSEYVPRSDQGTVTLKVPSNGVLQVKDVRPLRDWHSVTATSSDGFEIPVEPASRKAIGLWYLATDSDSNTFFLIGTRAQEEAFHKSNLRAAGPIAGPTS